MCMRREISEGAAKARIVPLPTVGGGPPQWQIVEVLTDVEVKEIRNERCRAIDFMREQMIGRIRRATADELKPRTK